MAEKCWEAAHCAYEALAGAGVGMLWASWGLQLVIAVAASHIPRLQEVRLDSASLAFTVGVSLITGLLFGFAPAWQVSKPDLNETLKEGSRGRSGVLHGAVLRPLLAVFEIALSLVLLISAGLMTRSLLGLLLTDRGFQPDHLLTVQLDFSVSGFTRPQVTLQQIIERISNRPGIRSVAAVSKLPRDMGSALTQTVVIENRLPTTRGEYATANFQGVTPNYFRTMGIPPLEGRSNDAPSVAIINKTMANCLFPNENPIGKRLALRDRNNPG